MKNSIKKFSLACTTMLLLAQGSQAQVMADSNAAFVPNGKLWGYAFGDLSYKGATDDANRGGSNQYTKVPLNENQFQFRRVYLGYDYNISKNFSAEFLFAAEDNFTSGVLGQGTGDVLANNKFAPYVKLANIRWKNIYKNADLVVGQSATPTFAKNGSGMASEEVWGYRSIERTITDIRRTTSFDMGIALQGKFDSKGNYGYVVMVANGTGAKTENDNFKSFYGDIWGKFADKKIIVDLYQDYTRLNWGQYINGYKSALPSPNGTYYHERAMTKLFVAYQTKPLTVGVEFFMNTLLGDVNVTGKDGNTYYRTTKAMGLSVFAKAQVKKDKLNAFVRFDNYDPTGNLSNIAGEQNTKSYTATTSQYDPTTKEMFVTYGLDFTPIKNVHVMPNIWMNTYNSGLDATASNTFGTKYSTMNSGVTAMKGTDVLYRLTFYYVFGK